MSGRSPPTPLPPDLPWLHDTVHFLVCDALPCDATVPVRLACLPGPELGNHSIPTLLMTLASLV